MGFRNFAAAATLLALAGGVVMAQEGPRRVRRDPEAIRAEIGLTEEQASQIRRIHDEARKASIRQSAELRVARLELGELMAAETVDEARIAAKVKAIAELQAAALRQRTDSQLAVRRLVTAEQFQKMQQMKRRALRVRERHPRRHPAQDGVPGEPREPREPGSGPGSADEGDVPSAASL